ncbi:MAG: terminase small subunit [Thermodesulfobacteriota bacterium]
MPAPKGNKFALGNKGSQPKYKNAESLYKDIDGYFNYIQGEYREKEIEIKEEDVSVTKNTIIETIRYPESPTVTGLALFLGFSSRQSIYDYIGKEEYSYILKRAVTVIENHHEKRMDGVNVAGSIFVLKNMGWKDKTEVDVKTSIKGIKIND